jgi:hypothetical protein
VCSHALEGQATPAIYAAQRSFQETLFSIAFPLFRVTETEIKMALGFNRMFFALVAGAVGGALVSTLRSESSADARPTAKRVVRAGVQFYLQAREAISEWSETASDLVAEVQAELEDERRRAAASGKTRREQVVPFEARPAPETERKLYG